MRALRALLLVVLGATSPAWGGDDPPPEPKNEPKAELDADLEVDLTREPAVADLPVPPEPGGQDPAPPISGPGVVDIGEPDPDPLRIGGTLYLRGAVQGKDPFDPQTTALAAPSLFDVYFDARVTDHLRGMVRARLKYDPVQASGTNPSLLLDQLWLRFDVLDHLFFTVGQQHVRWGVGRIWNPTDFLSPRPKDALARYDERPGASMIKLHVPWEATASNFYAITLLDNSGPIPTLSGLGLALRAETILFGAEIGVDAVFQGTRRPRYGADLSSALGPVDVVLEAALFRAPSAPLYEVNAATGMVEQVPDRPGVSFTAGASHTFRFRAENASAEVSVGGEYFFNTYGADDQAVYAVTAAQGTLVPFYAGRHYAAGWVALAGQNDLFASLSTVVNLSDRTGVTRLDAGRVLWSKLSVEGSLSFFWGPSGGEFKLNVGGLTPPLFEVGFGLRIDI